MTKIRPMKKGDIPRIQDFIRRHLEIEENWVYKGEYWYYWTLANLFSNSCLIAEDGEKILGFVSALKDQSNKEIYIEDILVSNSFRRQKIGSKLVSKLIKTAKENKCKSIWGTINPTNKISIDFFKACGFENKTEEFSLKIDFNGNGKIGKINEEVTFLNLKGQGEHRCIYQKNLS